MVKGSVSGFNMKRMKQNYDFKVEEVIFRQASQSSLSLYCMILWFMVLCGCSSILILYMLVEKMICSKY